MTLPPPANLRGAAVTALFTHFRNGTNLAEVLDRLFQGHSFSDQDRDLLNQIVFGVIRNVTLIDQIISFFAKKNPKELLLNILRISIYQSMFLERVPEYAIISEAMKVCDLKKLKTEEKKFIRGVLGAFMREKGKFSLDGSLVSSLPQHIRFSVPDWIIQEWKETLNESQVSSALSAAVSNPPVWGFPVPGKISVEELKTCLENRKVSFCLTEDGEGVAVYQNGSILKELFSKGILYSQSPHQHLAVSKCPAREGETILEIGAAPGGKTIVLSKKAGTQGRVYSLENKESRLRKLKERISFLGLSNVIPVLQDAMKEFPSDLPESFNHVVIDSPCSNLSELCRRPEARWRMKPEDLQRLNRVQEALVCKGWEKLKEGGTLLYITCTLSRKENQEIKEILLKRLGGSLLEDTLTVPNASMPAGGYFCLFRK